jgi:hypothetical protein
MKMDQTVTAQRDLLPQAFQDAFIQIAQKLRSETKLFFDARNTGRKTKADRALEKSYDELSKQAREKQISFGYAINLLVDAVFAHMSATRKVNVNELRPLRSGPADYEIDMNPASRLRISDARLYRAVNSFLDQERRAWTIHCPNVSTVVERDLTSLRRDFISELHEDGYVVYESQGDELRVKITQALIDNYYSPSETRADETPFIGNFSRIFKKG